MSDEKFSLIFNLKFKNTLMFSFKKTYENFTTGHVVKQYLLNELNEKMPNFKIERIEQKDECVSTFIELSDFYFFNSNKELIVYLIQNDTSSISGHSEQDNSHSKSSITITNLNSTEQCVTSMVLNEITNSESEDIEKLSNNLSDKQDLVSNLIRNSEKTKTLPTENGKYMRDWRRRVIKLIGSYILINK